MAHQGPDADRGVIISMMALLGKTDSLQISVNYINAQKVQDTSQVIQIFLNFRFLSVKTDYNHFMFRRHSTVINNYYNSNTVLMTMYTHLLQHL